jgi:hypothetical protein
MLAGLTGQKPSPSTVSRVHHTLEAEFAQWKNRPLHAHYRYLFADGTYFSVIYDGQGHTMPILAIIGISLARDARCWPLRWANARTVSRVFARDIIDSTMWSYTRLSNKMGFGVLSVLLSRMRKE